ncbi:MAG: radical SAM protein, partial [Pseudomonadota bacterium]
MDGILGVTYRCNARCVMCNTWQHPSDRKAEVHAEDLTTLPNLVRLNVTGGEPFLREDLGEILDVVRPKCKRVVISSNGFLTERIVRVLGERPDVGIRISIDGRAAVHEEIRGIKGGFGRAWTTVRELKDMGLKDLGIAVTVGDRNAEELVPVYHLACEEGVELATGILHNAFYFHKEDNRIDDPTRVRRGLQGLIAEYLKSRHPKDWFRAYFTQGLVNHMRGCRRELRCTMGTDSFFIDPLGDMHPCNVLEARMGNIKKAPFAEIWHNPKAQDVRQQVAACERNCWMIGSVGHLMR